MRRELLNALETLEGVIVELRESRTGLPDDLHALLSKWNDELSGVFSAVLWTVPEIYESTTAAEKGKQP